MRKLFVQPNIWQSLFPTSIGGFLPVLLTQVAERKEELERLATELQEAEQQVGHGHYSVYNRHSALPLPRPGTPSPLATT